MLDHCYYPAISLEMLVSGFKISQIIASDVIILLYAKASSRVLFNSSVGEMLHHGRCQKWLLIVPDTLRHHLLGEENGDALENHNGFVSIGGRSILITDLLMISKE